MRRLLIGLLAVLAFSGTAVVSAQRPEPRSVCKVPAPSCRTVNLAVHEFRLKFRVAHLRDGLKVVPRAHEIHRASIRKRLLRARLDLAYVQGQLYEHLRGFPDSG